jgi:DNA primase
MRRASGGLLDRFRDRLIFPIADLRGRVIAFGGRVLPGTPTTGDPPPKYLNSPESPIFHKSRTLYGLRARRDPERGRVAVVEGAISTSSRSRRPVGEEKSSHRSAPR